MSGNIVPRVTKAEHIGPDDTGDNIEAKRVANYTFDGTNWQRVSPSNPAPVKVYPHSNILHGIKTVTTAGTDVALAASTPCVKVDIQAQTDNTGFIAVGAVGVDATEATGTGIELEAGDVYSLEIDNLADIYIDATVSGEGVRYTYYTT